MQATLCARGLFKDVLVVRDSNAESWSVVVVFSDIAEKHITIRNSGAENGQEERTHERVDVGMLEQEGKSRA